jgi:hypothetical protein
MIARPSNMVKVSTVSQEGIIRLNTSSHTKTSSNTVLGTAVSSSILRSSPAILQQVDRTTIKATAKIRISHRMVIPVTHRTVSPSHHMATHPKASTELPSPAPKTVA